MPYLLDTGVFLSAVVEPERLSRRARELLADESGVLFLSAASSWEIAIKWAMGKLKMPDPPARWVPACLTRLRARPLDITHRHALEVADLPLHHLDPFDRLLIAQAKSEDLVLLTADQIFERYPVEVILCGASPFAFQYRRRG
jgi:PIN domain nuclease of toxin-antitoxin system